VLSALLSSYEDLPIPHNICFMGEVGLSGEIRAVNRIEQRIAEAEKWGLKNCIIEIQPKGLIRNSILKSLA
jgi:DNA repair protein RadA/Sms